MPSNDSHRAIQLEQEAEAWDLRQQGWTVRRIGAKLGIAHTTVSRMLDRVERRVLKSLSRRVERQKVTSTQILDHIRDEALQAWEKSKRNRTRVVKKTDANGEATVQEAVTREGDPTHLHTAMAADDRIRKIWGVDAPPAKPKDDESSGLNASSVAARLDANEAEHEATPDDADGTRDDPASGEAVEG